jgi:UDP-4-amino-4,6-dideoxy-L-N-acetyl-beta-L-altrosamine transaminase
MISSFLPYAKQSINEADVQAVVEALHLDLITRGAPVKALEEAVAAYCGARYAVAFSSGTAALMAAYFAAELSPFDRILSTPNSFIATVGAPLQKGARIQFIDIDRDTGNLCLKSLQEPLQAPLSRGRFFIVPVHFAGIAVDMKQLSRQICHPDAIIIEDAAHALGSCYPSGEKVGSCLYSDMTIFSFHPAKTITTGEGGMVLTNDEKLYHRLVLFRDNGIEREENYLHQPSAPGYYEVQAITGNYHLTSFQAALGLSQFNRLNSFISSRRALVKQYRKKLKNTPHLKLFTDLFDKQTAFHLMVVQIDFKAYHTTREALMEKLKERGIGSQMHYIPLYRHPVFKASNEEWQERFPQMEQYYAEALSLPLYASLTTAEVDKICGELLKVLKEDASHKQE